MIFLGQIQPVTNAARCAAAVLGLLALAGCGDYTSDYPDLMPTEQLLSQPVLPAHAAGTDESPLEVEAALTARASRATASTARRGADAGSTDLAARAAALQSRAKALSQISMEDAD